jgi:poly(hydroxyalkanoate) depolymerase family esterase
LTGVGPARYEAAMRPLALLFVAACAAAEAGDPAARARALEEVVGFGGNPGNLRMLRHVPDDLGPGAPLVVALHGCGERAGDAAAAGWSALAGERGFAVVYAEQRVENNPARCFNWTLDRARGDGENVSIVEMVARMERDHAIDAARVHVVGFSAGGAQAAVLLAAYPDVFAAGAILAGVPVGCGTACLRWPGVNLEPAEWAGRAREAHPGYQGAYPPVSLWTGTWDPIVPARNRAELLEQFSELAGEDRQHDAEEVIAGATRRRYGALETWDVPLLGHGVPVDARAGCGRASLYRPDVGLCAAARIADFFEL